MYVGLREMDCRCGDGGHASDGRSLAGLVGVLWAAVYAEAEEHAAEAAAANIPSNPSKFFFFDSARAYKSDKSYNSDPDRWTSADKDGCFRRSVTL